MKMNCAFRLSGRPRREGDQRDVVAGRVDIGKVSWLRLGAGIDTVTLRRAELRDRRQRRTMGASALELLKQPRIA